MCEKQNNANFPLLKQKYHILLSYQILHNSNEWRRWMGNYYGQERKKRWIEEVDRKKQIIKNIYTDFETHKYHYLFSSWYSFCYW